MTQKQIDELTAEEFSHFLSNEEEFCYENPHIAYDRAYDLYTSEHLGCLGDIDNTSHGGAQPWIGTLDSMMFQGMTSGLHIEHCISTAVC